MSFIYKGENHIVVFEKEMSFLNCRLEYIRKRDSLNCSFSFFVEREMYDREIVKVNYILHIDESIPSPLTVPSDEGYSCQCENDVGPDNSFLARKNNENLKLKIIDLLKMQDASLPEKKYRKNRFEIIDLEDDN